MADSGNNTVIAEFRANEGRVGGSFEGAPVILVRHRGRTSGRDDINPMTYLAADDDPTPSTCSPRRAAPQRTQTGTTTSWQGVAVARDAEPAISSVGTWPLNGRRSRMRGGAPHATRCTPTRRC